MEHTIKGLVIHHIRYADSSFIARIFTNQHGLKAYIVRSGKSAKSSKAHLLQPLTLVEFESSLKENVQIQQLKNLRIATPYMSIPFDPVKSAMVLFLDEILYKTLPDDYVNDNLFRFLCDAMVLLDDSLDPRNFHLWCLLEISRHYGFYPQRYDDVAYPYFDLTQGEFARNRPLHKMYIEGEDCLSLQQILDREWPEVQPVSLHSNIRKNLLESLVQYIKLHLENLREIKSLSVLHEVFH